MDDTTPKQQQILQAAWDVFFQYGYRRTSMADIAKAAGLSRPALYLEFANKEAIFRALVSAGLDESLVLMKDILAREGSAGAKLETAIDRTVIEHHRVLDSSPHGHEVFDLKNDMAKDLMDLWKADLEKILLDFFQSHVASTKDASDLATLAINSIMGLKSQEKPAEELALQARSICRSLDSILQSKQG